MKINLADILNASQAVKALMGTHYTNFNVVHGLVNLSQFMDKEIEFYIQQRKSIDEEKYQEGLTNLLKTEIDLPDNLVVTITAEDFADAKDIPTPMNVIALNKFVKFE